MMKNVFATIRFVSRYGENEGTDYSCNELKSSTTEINVEHERKTRS